MRKILVVGMVGCLLLTAVPSPVLAGDPHAVRNRWTGAAIGVGAVALGGLLLDAIYSPARVAAAPPAVVVPPPAVVYSPPPVVYSSPPVVVYPAYPTVVYAPAPIAVYHGWVPPGHWKKWRKHHWKHGWD